jgi:hypothetical protein
MNSTSGYYSLIRYCPDPSRQEFVNVGVAIYSPISKMVVTEFSPDNRRLSQVFGKQDLRFINRLKKSLEESFRRESFSSIADLESFIGRTANAIQLGPPRSMKILNLANDMSRLMERLVGEKPERKPRIQKYLEEKLQQAGIEKLVDKSVSIEIPSFDQSIRVPYAYQNGRYNLIAPVEFTEDLRDIFSKAGEKAIEGQELYQTQDPRLGDLHLIVVAKFAETTSGTARAKINAIFEQHNVDMYTFEDMAPLFDQIRVAAVDHGKNADSQEISSIA